MVLKGRNAKGERIHTAKLTTEKVQSIRFLREGGTDLTTLAMLFGVTISSVSRIVSHQNWKHV